MARSISRTVSAQGSSLEPSLWQNFRERIDNRRFPPFRCNVFFQYKTAEFMLDKGSPHYSDWNAPYFQVSIANATQLDTLSDLETSISSDGIVSYASPAFYKNEDLFTHWLNSEMIENSNFKPSQLLQSPKHSCYTYAQAQGLVRAFSTPTEFRGINLLDAIHSVAERSQTRENSGFIRSLAERIRSVLERRQGRINESFQRIRESVGLVDDPLAQSFFEIFIFTFLTHTTWLIYTTPSSEH